jgi:hypothetical protein
MKTPNMVGLAFALTAALGCAGTGGRIIVTQSPGTDSIPMTVAIYPLLSTEVEFPHHRPGGHPPGPITYSLREGSGDESEEDRVYISPPTESKLVVTTYSQLFSDLLAADMSYNGFTLKQLPVEAPVGGDDTGAGGQQFYVSMRLLDRLRDEFGLRAVLLGNVYFVPDRYDPGDVEVKAVYVKVVDVVTLDVLCHVSVTRGYYGADMEDVVAEIAAELAAMTRQGARPAEHQ